MVISALLPKELGARDSGLGRSGSRSPAPDPPFLSDKLVVTACFPSASARRAAYLLAALESGAAWRAACSRLPPRGPDTGAWETERAELLDGIEERLQALDQAGPHDPGELDLCLRLLAHVRGPACAQPGELTVH